MNRDQPSIRRTLIALAAFAFSALTIAATVVLPAKTGSPNADTGIVAFAGGPAAITPDFRMRVEVVGVREPDVAVDPRWRATRRAEAVSLRFGCPGE